MKIGMRSPSLSRSFKARTTGKYKRRAKRAINPLYGKKGVGFAKNPGKSIKSAVYHRTTFGVGDVVKMTSSSSKRTSSSVLRFIVFLSPSNSLTSSKLSGPMFAMTSP